MEVHKRKTNVVAVAANVASSKVDLVTIQETRCGFHFLSGDILFCLTALRIVDFETSTLPLTTNLQIEE